MNVVNASVKFKMKISGNNDVIAQSVCLSVSGGITVYIMFKNYGWFKLVRWNIKRFITFCLFNTFFNCIRYTKLNDRMILIMWRGYGSN
jgi:hypothetical protein